MIPKKETKDVDLNASIDKDIEKSKQQQEEKIKKNKPKLAQAVGSKYFKIVIIGIFGLVIAYKMFFAPTPEQPKKKKAKSSIAKSDKEDNQKQFADAGISKVKGEINKTKVDTKQVISLDNQTLSNTESLDAVSVPKLNLPDVPEIPKIDKLTIKEVVEEKQTKQEEKNIKTDEKSDTKDKEKKDEKKQTTNNKKSLNLPIDKKDEETNTKKVKKKVKDKDGKTVIVTELVEVDKKGNIVKNNDNENKIEENIINNNPLSKQMQDEMDELKEKAKAKAKKRNRMQDISNIGLNSLEEMFILSGKGNDSKTSSTDNKNDFIIFDNASIQEKQVMQEETSSNISRLSNLEHTIPAGKIIEGTLAQAINSESTGTISAIISKDVYGETGNKILIPKGSRAYGSYATTETKVQRRLLLTFTKIIRPDGIVITMTGDGYDQSGKKGVEGDIDTRYGELFKNSLLYSFATLGTALAIEKLTGVKESTKITSGGTTITNSPTTTAMTSVVDTASNIAEKMTDGLTDELDPIVSIPQGVIIKIISAQDIVIPVAYKVKKANG